MTQAALAALTQHGYEATSVAKLASLTGLSKAAFTYHFQSKEALLIEIAMPLIDDLCALEDQHPQHPASLDEVRDLLADYLSCLIRHGAVVAWIDADKAVLNHPDIGAKLQRSNRFMRNALAGAAASPSSLVQASAVLGMLWRPMRNIGSRDVERSRETLLTLTLATVEEIRHQQIL